MTEKTISLTPGQRVLFLTKDSDLLRRQLAGEADLRMEDLSVEDLLDRSPPELGAVLRCVSHLCSLLSPRPESQGIRLHQTRY